MKRSDATRTAGIAIGVSLMLVGIIGGTFWISAMGLLAFLGLLIFGRALA